MALKRILKKEIMEGPKPLIMEAYKDYLDKEKTAIGHVVLHLINA